MSVTQSALSTVEGFFSASLAESDPEIADVIGRELGRQRDEIELIASENIVCARRARGAGLGADQQIRRRLSGPALLRRLPVRRHRRDSSRSSARSKLFGCSFANVQPHSGAPGQPGGVPGADAAGRHLHGPRSRRRRPSDPRLAGQHVGQVVQAGALRRAARRPPHRHGRGRARSRASTSRS